MDQFVIEEVAAQPVAVVRRQASRAELSRVVPTACGVVWDFVRKHHIRAGRNIAIYHDTSMTLDCGVEVEGPFAAEGDVFYSATPAGRAVAAVHWGPYSELARAHDGIQAWCAAQGLKACLPCWEVYGHWSDDPAKVRTDVYYLLG